MEPGTGMDMLEDPHATPAPGQGALPPGHPAIEQPGAGIATQGTHATSLVWKAPASFAEAPNPSKMRLATYKVPRAGNDRDDAELSVTVAGGDVTANIERWAGQFEGGATPKKTARTVGTLKVTLVELSGTYMGGMGALSGSHPNWTLYAAIVETAAGESTFFKMTGPTATVKAGTAAFDAMIGGLTPAG